MVTMLQVYKTTRYLVVVPVVVYLVIYCIAGGCDGVVTGMV